jgi:hypothetical protein
MPREEDRAAIEIEPGVLCVYQSHHPLLIRIAKHSPIGYIAWRIPEAAVEVSAIIDTTVRVKIKWIWLAHFDTLAIRLNNDGGLGRVGFRWK